MPLPQYDVVKAEKADAMRKFMRNKQLGYCLLRLVPPCMLILCLSFSFWSPHTNILQLSSFISFPPPYCFYSFHYPSNTSSNNTSLSVSVPVAGGFSSHQLFPFLVLNVIVFLVYCLSTSHPPNSRRNDAVSAKPSEIYDQYVSYSSFRRTTAGAGDVTFEDKEIVHFEDVMGEKELKEDRQHRAVGIISERRPNYGRTKSDVTVTGEKKKSPRLLRTETEKQLVVVSSASASWSGDDKKSMEEMNSEEFRMTVERFIASKKKILMDEMTADHDHCQLESTSATVSTTHQL